MYTNTLFCVRPTLRNIGNDIINHATTKLLYEIFGNDTGIVNIPAIKGPQYGGFTSRQVYDANRLADGIIVGGGNLFENGQLTIDSQALDALNTPMMLIGLSHGRIYNANGKMIDRSDAMPPAKIQQLTQKSHTILVRDHATKEILDSIGCSDVEVGGCPTMFLDGNKEDYRGDGQVLISIRHPAKMSVAPEIQWRMAEDVRKLIQLLQNEYGDNKVTLLCHDYADLEFAAAFPQIPHLYFDNVDHYISALRNASLNVTYRLHAFLPCVAFGTPTIHLSYDERGRAMINTAKMSDWDISINNNENFIDAVMDRIKNIDQYFIARTNALIHIDKLRDITVERLKSFAEDI